MCFVRFFFFVIFLCRNKDAQNNPLNAPEEPGKPINHEELAGECVTVTYGEHPHAGWAAGCGEEVRITTPDAG